MKNHSISRRTLLAAGGIAAAGTVLGVAEHSRAADNPPGKIVFARNGNIWQWQGGNTEELLNDGAASDPRWSPDGSQFLLVRSGNSYSDLYVRSIDGSGENPLTYNQAQDLQIGSPDYVQASFWVADPSWSMSGIIGFASDAPGNAYDPDGNPYQIFALFIMNYIGADAMPMAQPLDDSNNYESITGISLSGDGSVSAYTSRGFDEDTAEYYSFVGLQDLGDQTYGAFVTDLGGSFDPAIEPTGSRVAMTIRSGEVTDIWLVDRDGGPRIQVTNGQNATKPCWASDGSWLAYYKMVDFKFEAWAVSVQGTTIGEPVKLFNFDDIDADSGLSWVIS